MAKRLSYSVGVSLLLLMGSFGCVVGTNKGDTQPEIVEEFVTLRLNQTFDGRLASCTFEGDCVFVSNPRHCTVVEFSINTTTGAVCETCMDAYENTMAKTCSSSSLSCTVNTAPDPDCLVCAHKEGVVLYSNCPAQAPQICVQEVGSDGEPCERCYDPDGRLIYDGCPIDCSTVVCPEIECADGFQAVQVLDECCEQCVPIEDCEEVICPMDVPVPECPEGTVLERDPVDCCVYQCVPIECESINPAQSCPSGYLWEEAYPHCGQCISDPSMEHRPCASTGECDTSEICTTELGACNPPPGCEPEEDCDAICYGICRPEDHDCGEINQPTGALDTAPTDAAPEVEGECEGEWESVGQDEFGCPLPPVCQCPDGVISLDGQCPDQCEGVFCYEADTPQCQPGYHLAREYPHCCGICVPDDECANWTWVSEGDSAGPTPSPSSTDSEDEEQEGHWEYAPPEQLSAGTMSCPEVQCASGFHLAPDEECCPTCVSDRRPCSNTPDCGSGHYCTIEDGDCNRPPDCSELDDCPEICYGWCKPRSRCSDSDGLNPDVRGEVNGVDSGGDNYARADSCTANGENVIEMWCFNPFPGSPQTHSGEIIFECANGCQDGRCSPSLSTSSSSSPED